MFTPIYLLPQYNEAELNRYRDRWETDEGLETSQRVLELIRNGAGEDFLQWDFENGRLPLLESMSDLKGLYLHGDFDFPDDETFEVIDFSYALISNAKMHNAAFPSTRGAFTEFVRCIFSNCSFRGAKFFGATFDECEFVECDFLWGCEFVNCDFTGGRFSRAFFERNVFVNCRFSETVDINSGKLEAHGTARPQADPAPSLDRPERSGIFRAIKEAYAAGRVGNMEDRYFVKEMEAITSAAPWKARPGRYFLQVVTNYGVAPFRVGGAMAAILFAGGLLFAREVGLRDGLVISAGAFFTFGVNASALAELPPAFSVLYVVEAFFGLSATALFITLLAARWFRRS